MIELKWKGGARKLQFREYVIAYYITVNAAAFLIFGMDKRSAREKSRRVPEDILLCFAAAGGALGALLSMLVFRHKTRKTRFTVLVPLFIFLHWALWWYLGGKI